MSQITAYELDPSRPIMAHPSCPPPVKNLLRAALRCLSCHYSCQDCLTFGANKCKSCPAGANRLATPELGSCNCIANYLDEQLQAVCCHYSCSACSTPTKCDQCYNTDLSHRQTQVNETDGTCHCMTGYFDTLGVRNCQPCHYSCETCEFPGAVCTSCSQDTNQFHRTVFNHSDELCYCDSGYYDHSSQKACQRCHYSCLTCEVSEVACLSCPSEAISARV